VCACRELSLMYQEIHQWKTQFSAEN
jgi:hypothetical protein